jgi:uncharacterized protein YndB with AHSA1/START domain
MRFELDVLINRAVDEVFTYLTDLDLQPEWQHGVIVSTHTPPGPPGLGTRVEKVRQTPMGRVRFTDEISAWDPVARTWTEQVVAGMVRGSGSRWSVRSEATGSRVHVDVWMRAAGLWRVFEPFIARTGERDMRADLQQLKRVLERST